MPRQDMLIDTVTQMFARQPVMLNIVDQFQLPDSNKSLKSKEQQNRQCQKPKLQSQPAVQHIATVDSLDGKTRAWHGAAWPAPRVLQKKALRQDPGEELVKTLVVACGDRVPRGSDIAMMYQQMLAAKMRIKHHRQKQISHPALNRSFVMHHFMAIVDANRARHHTQAIK